MTKSRDELTELEGAILGVLRRSGGLSAYGVRSVFLGSHSAEWSGSAGAVYPALARLKKGGFVATRSLGDRRGTKICALTETGKAAHESWVCDVARAAGPGLDPFRVRAADLSSVPARKRREFAASLARELEAQRSALKSSLSGKEPADAAMAELHIALIETRLAWLKRNSD